MGSGTQAWPAGALAIKKKKSLLPLGGRDIFGFDIYIPPLQKDRQDFFLTVPFLFLSVFHSDVFLDHGDQIHIYERGFFHYAYHFSFEVSLFLCDKLFPNVWLHEETDASAGF